MATDGTPALSACPFDDLPRHIQDTILLDTVSKFGLRVLCVLRTVSKRCRESVQEVFDEITIFDCKKDLAHASFKRKDFEEFIHGLMAAISKCTKLQQLDLSACHRHMTDHHIITLATATSPFLQHLERLTIRCCATLTDRGLWHLDISSCHGVEGHSFLQLLPGLQVLKADYCTNLAAAAVAPISGKLRHMSLNACGHVDDAVCTGSRAVEFANLAATSITDEGLLQLAACSPCLHTLVLSNYSYNLWHTGLYTEAGLNIFKEMRPEVTVRLVDC